MKYSWIQIAEMVIAALIPVSVVVYQLFSIPKPKPLSKSSFYTFGLATLLSSLFQFLVYIFGFISELEIVVLFAFGIIFVIAFMVVIITSSRKSLVLADSFLKSKHFFIIILLVNLIAPPILARGLINICDDRHKKMAMPLINAIAEYRADNNNYPSGLQLLIPDYLAEIPKPACFSIYRPFVSNLTSSDLLRSFDYPLMMKMIRLKKVEYHLMDCSVEEDGVHYGESYLLVSTFDLRNEQRYNFSRNSWQTIPFSYGCGSYSSNQRHELTQNPSFLFLLSSHP